MYSIARISRGCMAVALALHVTALAAGAQSKPRVAVLAFENNTTLSILGSRLGFAAADEVTTQLVKSGEFTVIERSQIETLISEQKLGQSGLVDAATAARIGRLLGAQAVITGSITQFSLDRKQAGMGVLSASYTEAESIVDVRMISVNTGEILVAAKGSGKKRFGGAAFKNMNFERDMDAGTAQQALRPAITQAVDKVRAQKVPLAGLAAAEPMGKVVGMRGGDYYIDRGANTGIKAGQRFEVVRVTDRITDASGKVLDEVTETVGTLEVSRVLSQSAICKLVKGSAKEGDSIRSP
jgi:curli biogenesis system outer membrane secretion channel CsgG